MNKLILFFVLCILFSSCKEEVVSIPKPRMYPKVVYPIQNYQLFQKGDCPISFEYPTYAMIKQSEAYYKDQDLNDCWFDIEYGSLNATLYCSYSDVESKEALSLMIDKNYLLVNKHNRRADFIDENLLYKNNNPIGVQFEIDGEVATPYQFFLTDSLNHFFRASLYFNSKLNQDSVAPIYNFIKTDVDRMIETFEWEYKK